MTKGESLRKDSNRQTGACMVYLVSHCLLYYMSTNKYHSETCFSYQEFKDSIDSFAQKTLITKILTKFSTERELRIDSHLID